MAMTNDVKLPTQRAAGFSPRGKSTVHERSSARHHRARWSSRLLDPDRNDAASLAR